MTHRFSQRTIVVLVAILACASVASGHLFRFFAPLDSGTATPPNQSSAEARADLLYTHHNFRFDLELEVLGITPDQLKPTGPNQTSVHLRFGTPTQTGDIAVDLGIHATPQPTDDGFRMLIEGAFLGGPQGLVSSDPFAVEQALIQDTLYVVVYTHDHPEGEIRGRLRVLGIGRCPADLTGPGGAPDGILDASDFFEFLDAFSTGQVFLADLKQDGVLDAQDFFRYLEAFTAGCSSL